MAETIIINPTPKEKKPVDVLDLENLRILLPLKMQLSLMFIIIIWIGGTIGSITAAWSLVSDTNVLTSTVENLKVDHAKLEQKVDDIREILKTRGTPQR